MRSICIMICFVVAGVGVDDMIVIENFYQKALDSNMPRGSRMPYALRHGGLSVFLTSASSIFAFASGTSLHIPGIVQFCTCGSLCFTWIFFLSITFFPAVLCIDQQRVEKNLPQCVCCFNCCTSNSKVQAGDPGGDSGSVAADDGIKSSWAGEMLTPILTSQVRSTWEGLRGKGCEERSVEAP